MRIHALEANSYKNQNVSTSFGGKIGSRLISQVVSGTPLEANDVFNSMRKSVGMSRSKIKDIVESFVSYINRITHENKIMKNQIKDLRSEVSRQKRVRASVRAIDDLEVPTPFNAIKIIKEMSENAINARKSLYTYLTTGAGEQEALKQIERNMLLYKASNSGILNIPKVSSELKNNKYADARISTKFILDMLTDSLSASPNPENLYSSAVREQIRINATALFNPIFTKNPNSFGSKSYNDMLSAAVDKALNRYTVVSNNKQRYSGIIIKDNFIPFDFEGSNLILRDKERLERTVSYPQFMNLQAVKGF